MEPDEFDEARVLRLKELEDMVKKLKQENHSLLVRVQDSAASGQGLRTELEAGDPAVVEEAGRVVGIEGESVSAGEMEKNEEGEEKKETQGQDLESNSRDDVDEEVEEGGDVLDLSHLSDEPEEEWLYVSPLRMPTPAQKKTPVLKWLSEGHSRPLDGKDVPSLDDVRKSLSFHINEAEALSMPMPTQRCLTTKTQTPGSSSAATARHGLLSNSLPPRKAPMGQSRSPQLALRMRAPPPGIRASSNTGSSVTGTSGGSGIGRDNCEIADPTISDGRLVVTRRAPPYDGLSPCSSEGEAATLEEGEEEEEGEGEEKTELQPKMRYHAKVPREYNNMLVEEERASIATGGGEEWGGRSDGPPDYGEGRNLGLRVIRRPPQARLPGPKEVSVQQQQQQQRSRASRLPPVPHHPPPLSGGGGGGGGGEGEGEGEGDGDGYGESGGSGGVSASSSLRARLPPTGANGGSSSEPPMPMPMLPGSGSSRHTFRDRAARLPGDGVSNSAAPRSRQLYQASSLSPQPDVSTGAVNGVSPVQLDELNQFDELESQRTDSDVAVVTNRQQRSLPLFSRSIVPPPSSFSTASSTTVGHWRLDSSDPREGGRGGGGDGYLSRSPSPIPRDTTPSPLRGEGGGGVSPNHYKGGLHKSTITGQAAHKHQRVPSPQRRTTAVSPSGHQTGQYSKPPMGRSIPPPRGRPSGIPASSSVPVVTTSTPQSSRSSSSTQQQHHHSSAITPPSSATSTTTPSSSSSKRAAMGAVRSGLTPPTSSNIGGSGPALTTQGHHTSHIVSSSSSSSATCTPSSTTAANAGAGGATGLRVPSGKRIQRRSLPKTPPPTGSSTQVGHTPQQKVGVANRRRQQQRPPPTNPEPVPAHDQSTSDDSWLEGCY